MGHIFTFNDAVASERWMNDPRNRYRVEQGNRLMLDMLKPVRGETVLDIGCGTGASSTPLVERELQATGIEPSPYR